MEMLIPQECHKGTLHTPTASINTSWVPAAVAATSQSWQSKQHEEKERRERRRRRRKTLILDLEDEFEPSSETRNRDKVGSGFSSLLNGLADAY